MGQVQINDKAYIERRMQQYREDTFIKGCLAAIQRIIKKTSPVGKLDVHNNTFEVGMDETVRFNIEWWKMQMETHVRVNYPDIITEPSISLYLIQN